MTRYLYGAAVSGIQRYIFATNKLKEIIGASELVDRICTSLYEDIFKEMSMPPIPGKNILLKAAGNIRLVLEKKEAEILVREFPLRVEKEAPGARLIQGVVSFQGEPGAGEFEELEKKLAAQKNRPLPPVHPGVSAVARCYRTERPVIRVVRSGEKNETKHYIDKNCLKKQTASQSFDLVRKMLTPGAEQSKFPSRLTQLVTKEKRHWLGIIHLDGNNMGRILKELRQNVKTNYQETYKAFSDALNRATVSAAASAFNSVVKKRMEKEWEKEKVPEEQVYPFRPIVLGGDDVTVLCRGDMALDFAAEYVKNFEENTKKEIEKIDSLKIPGEGNNLWHKKGLTACGGIVYAKNIFPLHYSLRLAEELCARAKTRSRDLDGNTRGVSSLLFHRVLSSYHTNYEAVLEEKKMSGINLEAGPYTVMESRKGQPSLKSFTELKNLLKDKSNPKQGEAQGEQKADSSARPTFISGIRKWLGELNANPQLARLKLKRSCTIFEEKDSKLYEELNNKLKKISEEGSPGIDFPALYSPREKESENITPLGDLLTILSIEGDRDDD